MIYREHYNQQVRVVDYDSSIKEQMNWQETKPGWYEAVVIHNGTTYQAQHRKHDEVVQWLYDNIDMCERHCRWAVDPSNNPNATRVKFRYEKDYMWFKLRW
jgi:hypothetical protein